MVRNRRVEKLAQKAPLPGGQKGWMDWEWPGTWVWIWRQNEIAAPMVWPPKLWPTQGNLGPQKWVGPHWNWGKPNFELEIWLKVLPGVLAIVDNEFKCLCWKLWPPGPKSGPNLGWQWPNRLALGKWAPLGVRKRKMGLAHEIPPKKMNENMFWPRKSPNTFVFVRKFCWVYKKNWPRPWPKNWKNEICQCGPNKV